MPPGMLQAFECGPHPSRTAQQCPPNPTHWKQCACSNIGNNDGRLSFIPSAHRIEPPNLGFFQSSYT